VCVCSFSYSACAVLYYHLWPVRLYHIFPHYLINSTILTGGGEGEQFIEHKTCVLIFSTTFVWNISHSDKNSARYDKKCMSVFIYSLRCSCQILIITEFSQKILEKYTNTKFKEIPPSGSRVVSRGETEGLTKLIVAFCNFANAPKNRRTVELKTGRTWIRKWIHVFQVRAGGVV
jgi:hypothetical protein